MDIKLLKEAKETSSFSHSHCEERLLRDAHERGGAREDEDEDSEEDVHGQVGLAEVRRQPREQKRDQAADPLRI